MSSSHPLLSGASPGSRENTKSLFARTLALSFSEAAHSWSDLFSLQSFLMDRSLVDLVSCVSQAIKQPQSAVS